MATTKFVVGEVVKTACLIDVIVGGQAVQIPAGHRVQIMAINITDGRARYMLDYANAWATESELRGVGD